MQKKRPLKRVVRDFYRVVGNGLFGSYLVTCSAAYRCFLDCFFLLFITQLCASLGTAGRRRDRCPSRPSRRWPTRRSGHLASRSCPSRPASVWRRSVRRPLRPPPSNHDWPIVSVLSFNRFQISIHFPNFLSITKESINPHWLFFYRNLLGF